MNRILLALALAAVLSSPGARAFDWPDGLDFQLGFSVGVAPGPKDASRHLGLVVAPDRIVSDKVRSLAVSGTITNYGSAPCEGVEMVFLVTSYIGAMSRGRAAVTPSTIPPGGTATFSLHMNLDSEKPRLAMYTVTASTPYVLVQEPVYAAPAVPVPCAPPVPADPVVCPSAAEPVLTGTEE